jgi:hypothetical protein
MTVLSLTGIDARNPLAYFAALGLLRVLDDHHVRTVVPRPKLSFVDRGQQVAVLETALDLDNVIEVVLADAAAEADNAALRLAYDDQGHLANPFAPDSIRDLKPSPAAAREYLSICADAGRRTAALASGFFSELVEDNAGKTKPTALHFTAGQQTFLAMVELLRAGIAAADVREALVGPWRNESTLPSLSWDASVSRLYALRATNPSSEKRGSVAAANWLAIHSLAFFPVNARGDHLATGSVAGTWKESSLFWPLWTPPLGSPVVASLLRMDSRRFSARERAALGITHVFTSRISRSDQGGYGSFSPADVVIPVATRR